MQPSAAARGQCAAPVVGCLPVCTLWTVGLHGTCLLGIWLYFQQCLGSSHWLSTTILLAGFGSRAEQANGCAVHPTAFMDCRVVA